MIERKSNFISKYRKMPPEFNIFLVLLGMAVLFEILGWIFIGQSFILNKRRLVIMILQVSVIGIIAVGVTQVIIMAGIDLSGGSLVALSAIVSGRSSPVIDTGVAAPTLVEGAIAARWPAANRNGPADAA